MKVKQDGLAGLNWENTKFFWSGCQMLTTVTSLGTTQITKTPLGENGRMKQAGVVMTQKFAGFNCQNGGFAEPPTEGEYEMPGGMKLIAGSPAKIQVESNVRGIVCFDKRVYATYDITSPSSVYVTIY
jgi:hypothetical protein